MIRIGNQHNQQDYYTFEPAALQDGSACVPVRWIRRGESFVCLAWRFELSATRDSWTIREDQQLIVPQDSLLWSLPVFEQMASTQGLPSPHAVHCKSSLTQVPERLSRLTRLTWQSE